MKKYIDYVIGAVLVATFGFVIYQNYSVMPKPINPAEASEYHYCWDAKAGGEVCLTKYENTNNMVITTPHDLKKK